MKLNTKITAIGIACWIAFFGLRAKADEMHYVECDAPVVAPDPSGCHTIPCRDASGNAIMPVYHYVWGGTGVSKERWFQIRENNTRMLISYQNVISHLYTMKERLAFVRSVPEENRPTGIMYMVRIDCSVGT